MTRFGWVRLGPAGEVRCSVVGSGGMRFGRHGRTGTVGYGGVRCGEAGMDWREVAYRGQEWCGQVIGRRGAVRPGEVRYGRVRQACQGTSRSGTVYCGMAGVDRKVRSGWVRQARLGATRIGLV